MRKRPKTRVPWRSELSENPQAELDTVTGIQETDISIPTTSMTPLKKRRNIVGRTSNKSASMNLSQPIENVTSDVIGAKIAILWPHDKKYYDCWVLWYPCAESSQNKALHKVVYDDADNHVEYVNMRTRSWRFVTDKPRSKESLVGKKIKLAVSDLRTRRNYRAFKDKKNPKQSVKSIIAFVIDDHLEEDPEGDPKRLSKFIDVDFEILTTEDLNQIPYTLVNTLNHQPLSTKLDQEKNEQGNADDETPKNEVESDGEPAVKRK